LAVGTVPTVFQRGQSLRFKDVAVEEVLYTSWRDSKPIAEKSCADSPRHTTPQFMKCGGAFVYKIYNSKPIIDEIDELLAKHYGFTEEELDFIINYDIKYRMGDELNAE